MIIYDGYDRRLDCVGAHVAVVLLMRWNENKRRKQKLKQAKGKTENMSTDMSTGRQHIWQLYKINKVLISKGQDSWRGKCYYTIYWILIYRLQIGSKWHSFFN